VGNTENNAAMPEPEDERQQQQQEPPPDGNSSETGGPAPDDGDGDGDDDDGDEEEIEFAPSPDEEEDDDEDAQSVQQEDDDDGGGGGSGAGAAEPSPHVKPSYELWNGMRFWRLCLKFERLVYDKRIQKNKNRKGGSGGASASNWTTAQRLEYLLPDSVLAATRRKEQGKPPESIYPLFRLVMPDKDSSRSYLVKESNLAKMYGAALGLSKDHEDYRKLVEWTDPQVVGTTAVGDFSLVLYEVVKSRVLDTDRTGSDFTVGEINELLDELCDLRKRSGPQQSNHDQPGPDGKRKRYGAARKLSELQARWAQKLLMPGNGREGLSPIEHKWLVRILLQRLQIGLGWATIMKRYVYERGPAAGLFDVYRLRTKTNPPDIPHPSSTGMICAPYPFLRQRRIFGRLASGCARPIPQGKRNRRTM